MLNKIISLSTLFCMLMVVLIAKWIPDSPLFYFIAPEKWLMLARLTLVGAMIWLSFRGYIRRKQTRQLINRVGITMMTIGAFMLMAIQLNGYLFDYFKPLDLLLLVEAGAVFSLTSMAAKPNSVVKTGKTRRAAG